MEALTCRPSLARIYETIQETTGADHHRVSGRPPASMLKTTPEWKSSGSLPKTPKETSA
ncbi:hypothetical protein ARTHRO9AX_220142 [Arthrobacter sp. 9AX]|nr:hypothetical protein ARTHRO9AX_220142 [Arthrobacter sp. 9AX]